MLPLGSLDEVHIFFPDPWHKTKHNKRRLIQSPLVAKLARRLKVGWVPTNARLTGSPTPIRFWKC